MAKVFRDLIRVSIEKKCAWKIPNVLRQILGPRTLVVASTDKLHDRNAQKMWVELTRVGIEPYILRCSDGFPNSANVEDGLQVINRTGASSIVCIGSLGTQETCKLIQYLQCIGASTLEQGIERMQQNKPQRTALPIALLPTEIAPPVWLRRHALAFHPSIPALADFVTANGQMHVFYDPDFIFECHKADRSSMSQLAMIAAFVDLELHRPGCLTSSANTLPHIYGPGSSLSNPDSVAQAANWMIDNFCQNFGDYTGLIETVATLSNDSDLRVHPTAVYARALQKSLETVEQYQEDLRSLPTAVPLLEADHGDALEILSMLRAAFCRTAKALGCKDVALSDNIHRILKQAGPSSKLPMAELEIARELMATTSPHEQHVISRGDILASPGCERATRLILSCP